MGIKKTAVQNTALNRYRIVDQRGPGMSQIFMWLEDSSIYFHFTSVLFTHSHEH